jgi:thymidylate kinase
MLIIIEGVDCSGKTTLARRIEKELGYKYHHFSTPKTDNPVKEYSDFLLDLPVPTVTDRFYLGERVYGPILRGTSKITDLEWVTLERLCRLRAAVLIFMTTPLEVCQARFDHIGLTIEQNALAYDKFKEVVKHSSLTMRTYSAIMEESTDVLMTWIKGWYKTIIQTAQQATQFHNGIGTITGDKLIFVGEAVNEKSNGLNVPFCRGHASEYLLKVMQEAEVPEERVYVCNADKLTLQEAEFIDTTRSSWLALGKKADAKLTELGIFHHTVNHPQYESRFHHNHSSSYVEKIRMWKDRCR